MNQDKFQGQTVRKSGWKVEQVLFLSDAQLVPFNYRVERWGPPHHLVQCAIDIVKAIKAQRG